MKILSMQNRNNRPVAFGDLRSVVAGETFRDGEHYIALALKATGDDLEGLRDVFDFFPSKNGEGVLNISATGHYYEAALDSFDKYRTFVNGKGFSWSDNVWEMLTHPEKQNELAVVKNKINSLLDKVFRLVKLDIPKKNSAERREMRKIIAPKGQLKDWELARDENGVKNIISLLMPIIDDGETFF